MNKERKEKLQCINFYLDSYLKEFNFNMKRFVILKWIAENGDKDQVINFQKILIDYNLDRRCYKIFISEIMQFGFALNNHGKITLTRLFVDEVKKRKSEINEYFYFRNKDDKLYSMSKRMKEVRKSIGKNNI